MFTNRKFFCMVILTVCLAGVYAFDTGFTVSFKANLTGSLTRPYINKKDMDYLGAQFMEGMLGYVTTGETELTYIFGSKRFFGLKDASIFSGLGLAVDLGLGQGFSGQISGSYNKALGGNIRVYCNVFMAPVLSAGTSLKTYFFNNRLSVNGRIGVHIPLDPRPVYEMYSNLSEKQLKTLYKEAGIDFGPETGTLVVSPEQMRKINPVGCTLKFGVDYYQPFLERMQITMGAFLSYLIYKPGYVTMPKKIEHAAKVNGESKTPKVPVDFAKHPIKSFYMNALNFGLTVGLLFKV